MRQRGRAVSTRRVVRRAPAKHARVAAALLCVAALAGCSGRSPEPAPSSSPGGSGTAECSEELIAEAVRADFDANYPGSSFVSLDAFTCEGGWAKADAQFEASGSTFPTVVLLRANDGAWTAVVIEDACRAPQSESGMPSAIYDEVCGAAE